MAAARAAGRSAGRDGYAFVISFKSTLLEGLEVAFIVITLGANQGATGLAAAGAAVALVGRRHRRALVARTRSAACPRTRSSSRSA